MGNSFKAAISYLESQIQYEDVRIAVLGEDLRRAEAKAQEIKADQDHRINLVNSLRDSLKVLEGS